MEESKSNPVILPNEIWHKILSYLGTNDLLSSRLVWPQFDNEIIKLARLTEKKVNILDMEHMNKFLNIVQNNIQTTELRFSKFTFQLLDVSWSSLEIFFNHVQDDVLEVALDLWMETESKVDDSVSFASKINMCLNALRNLEKLDIDFFEDDMLRFDINFPPLEKLKEFCISAKPVLHNETPKTIYLSTLCKWLQKTPNLKIFSCDFGDLNVDTDIDVSALQKIPEINFTQNMDCTKASPIHKFSDMTVHLTSLKVHIHCTGKHNFGCPLHIDFATAFILLLFSQSSCLRELIVISEIFLWLEFPLMKKLEILHLHDTDLVDDHIRARLDSEAFPNLLEVKFPRHVEIFGEFNKVKIEFPNVGLYNARRGNFPNANDVCVKYDNLEELESLQNFPSVDQFELVFDFVILYEKEQRLEDAAKLWNLMTNGSKMETESPFFISGVNDVDSAPVEEPRRALQLQWGCHDINALKFSICDAVVVKAVAYLSFQKLFPRQKKLTLEIYPECKESISDEIIRILTENHDNVFIKYDYPHVCGFDGFL